MCDKVFKVRHVQSGKFVLNGISTRHTCLDEIGSVWTIKKNLYKHIKRNGFYNVTLGTFEIVEYDLIESSIENLF